MPKGFLQKQEEVVNSVEAKQPYRNYDSPYDAGMAATKGMREAYNEYRYKKRRNAIINTVAGVAATGAGIVAITATMPFLFLPLVVWAGWNVQRKLFHD